MALRPAKTVSVRYPSVDQAEALKALQASYPVWETTTPGEIRAANKPAFWLWNALDRHQHPVLPALLGRNLFEVMARPENFDRIELPDNANAASYRFFLIKASIARRLRPRTAQDKLAFEKFIGTMHHTQSPLLDKIASNPPTRIEQEWQYTLSILHPYYEETRLHFRVEVFWLKNGRHTTGNVSICRPLHDNSTNHDTINIVDQAYKRLLSVNGAAPYACRLYRSGGEFTVVDAENQNNIVYSISEELAVDELVKNEMLVVPRSKLSSSGTIVEIRHPRPGTYVLPGPESAAKKLRTLHGQRVEEGH